MQDADNRLLMEIRNRLIQQQVLSAEQTRLSSAIVEHLAALTRMISDRGDVATDAMLAIDECMARLTDIIDRFGRKGD